MAEEKVEEKVEKDVEEKVEIEPMSVDAIATKLGWNADYNGDGREFVSSEDYILRSKEIQDTQVKQNKSLKIKLSEFEDGLKSLKKHNEAVYEVQVAQLKNEIAALKTQRKEAVEDDDKDRVSEIDDRIDELKKVPDKVPEDLETSATFKEWVEKNDWYTEDSELKKYAEIQAQGNAKYQGLSEKRFYETMTRDVKEMFPEKFESPQKAEKKVERKVAAVEGGSRKAVRTKHTSRDLNESQLKSMRFFAEQDVMTEAEYIKELEQIGELA